MDGGVEGGALEQPYASNPANSGHLNWEPAVMTRVCTEAVRRGWRIGTHAAGDRAVRAVLEVYESVAACGREEDRHGEEGACQESCPCQEVGLQTSIPAQAGPP